MANENEIDDRDAFAAEFVLGLLDGAELHRAQTFLREDSEFASQVSRWTRHFEPWFAEWQEVDPPQHLKRRVLAAAGIGAANTNELTRWRWATAISTAVAAALGIFVLSSSQTQRLPEPLQTQHPRGQLMAVAFKIDDGDSAFPAMVDLGQGLVRLPTVLEIPPGKVAQLWLIEGNQPPAPMGVFQKTASGLAATMTIEHAIPAGSVLAISIEPSGGSPTGKPTGPVVATGELKIV